MRLNREKITILLLPVVVLSLLYLRLPDFFSHPNQRVIEPYGDGFKAYTAILYHACYDSSYAHFEGMNHPYGEHAIPAATQPLISNSLIFLRKLGLDLSGYTIGIVHIFMLISILLCCLFLYLLFRKLKVGPFFALAVSVGLTFLSPQIARMSSHYGLAHPEVIPLCLYLLLLWEKEARWRYSWLMTLVVAAYSLIHFYHFAILALTTGLFFVFHFLSSPKWRNLPLLGLHFAIQLLLPLVAISLWVHFTDPVTDRNDAPWGFFAFRAFPEGLLTSLAQPHFNWLDQHLISIRRVGFEGRSYIGLVACAFSLWLLLRWLANRLVQSPLPTWMPRRSFLSKLLSATVLLLLFSFGLPFIIPGLEPWLDWTGPVRQFRSIGRFAWPFYDLINLTAFTWLYHYAQRRNGRWRWAVAWGAILLLAFEAFHQNTAVDLRLDEVERFEEGNRFTDLPIAYDDHQAILTVPYYNIGSDNFWWEPEGFVLQQSLTLSIQTGLPTTSAMLTRTSLSQTLRQLQLATEPYRLPSVLSDLPNQKPFLVVWDQREFERERDKYEHLLEGTDLLHREERLRLYRMPLSSFGQRLHNRKKRILDSLRSADLIRLDTHFLSDSRLAFRYISYDDKASERIYRGGGAYAGPIDEPNIIYEGALPQGGEEVAFRISFWMYLAEDLRGRTQLAMKEYDPATGWEKEHDPIQVWRLAKAFDTNGWSLIEWDFSPDGAATHLQLQLTNPRAGDATLYADELLIRPRGADLYFLRDTIFGLNNRHWRTPSL